MFLYIIQGGAAVSGDKGKQVTQGAAVSGGKDKQKKKLKKSEQIANHQHFLVAGGGAYDLEAVGLEVKNTMLTHDKSWDTMDKDEKDSICQFVLDNIAAMPSSNHGASLPEIADVVTAVEELLQNVLFLFAV